MPTHRHNPAAIEHTPPSFLQNTTKIIASLDSNLFFGEESGKVLMGGTKSEGLWSFTSQVAAIGTVQQDKVISEVVVWDDKNDLCLKICSIVIQFCGQLDIFFQQFA